MKISWFRIERRAALGLLALSVLGLVACGNPYGGGGFSRVDASHDPGLPDVSGNAPVTIPSSKGTEFVSSSLQNAPTVQGHYRISASLSGKTQQWCSQTTNGYKLFSNIQGDLLSSGVGL